MLQKAFGTVGQETVSISKAPDGDLSIWVTETGVVTGTTRGKYLDSFSLTKEEVTSIVKQYYSKKELQDIVATLK